jgi:elongation factor 1-beta
VCDDTTGYSPDSQPDQPLTPCLAQLDAFPHTARWFKHVASFAGETSKLPAGKVPFAGVAAAAPAAAEEEDDEDVDLFGSDDEEDDAEAERVKAERIAAYTAAKEAKKQEKLASGKKLEVAKSVVTLQVKPWDDETDMVELEKVVRSIEKDGLVWGASKLVPVGYGIKMLQVTVVIEDAKISLDELQEQIAEDGEDVSITTPYAATEQALTISVRPVYGHCRHAEALSNRLLCCSSDIHLRFDAETAARTCNRCDAEEKVNNMTSAFF